MRAIIIVMSENETVTVCGNCVTIWKYAVDTCDSCETPELISWDEAKARGLHLPEIPPLPSQNNE